MKFIQGTRREFVIIGIGAFISCAVYIAYSVFESGLGFPLDDAWIHQTFARNLANYGEWSFISGENSGASTAPLWGFILAIPHFLGFPPIWGTYLFGFIIVWALGVGGYNLGSRLFPDSKTWPLVMGLICTLEWHLIWSALSGMETMILSLLALIMVCWLIDKRNNWGTAGLLIGLTIWIRPDGLTLLGPVLMSLIFRAYKPKRIIWSLIALLTGLLVVILPYLLFNYVVAGDVLPNTFYAKQAEYAFLRDYSIIDRLGTVSYQIVIGVGIVLLPGLVVEAIDSVKSKDWERIGAFLWAFGYILIYAWRLPVAYQHGRYIMPVMPVIFLLGLAGMLRVINLQSALARQRIISKSWIAVSGLTLLLFWVLGARSYALDVGVINTEMVQSALWIKQHTEEGSIIAAHDIGALGYFGERQIRDLAGLITPEVIPFLWDDARLTQYLNNEGVDYLYSFVDWYPGIIKGLDIAYQSSGEYAAKFGMESTAVYYWNSER